ncbi:DUF456 domain-containing protein [Roseimaritima ulvae]|uniref:DUF456 domain-containing protein n=1 Tax=Roseimaritima ulvae TaxID=980254 RepID=A0A5B9QP44_9BACT|nr:DUF456 domain-containing protein [Roseimaritima ulvae]QEG38786.1 hypothetical protein UC8_07440 [Roseimaritima ulvae]
MSTTIEITWAVGLLLICTVGWGLNLIALPGNWFAVATVALYAWLGPEEGRVAVGWGVLAAVFVCALVGELLEFAAAAMGAQRAGASRRSTMLAIVGSMVGAVLGAVVGLPFIPVLGPVVAAVLFGALGATAGAMLGEWSDGKSWRESWPIGHAAFWGRLLGTVGKILAGLAILVVILLAVCF